MKNAVTVKELRKIAQERGIGSGTWRAGATKAELQEAIRTGHVGPPSQKLAQQIAHAVSDLLTPGPDEAFIRKIVREELTAIFSLCASTMRPDARRAVNL